MFFFRHLARDQAGAMIIESAFVIPILALLGLGGFETSRIIARNTELQTALAEAAAITLTKPPEADPDLATIKAMVMRSTGLTTQGVTLLRKYRCNAGDIETTKGGCAEKNLSSYVEITLVDTYQPIWVGFGVGGPIEYNFSRTVQIS